MEGIINTGILEEMHQIKLLAAIGLSKTKSEEIKLLAAIGLSKTKSEELKRGIRQLHGCSVKGGLKVYSI
jgi:hypothetical protein